MKVTKSFVLAGIVVLILTSLGCSSGKKTSAPSQVYHDITARNNAFFNGQQKIKTIQKTVETSYQDDFDEILALRTNRDPKLTTTFGSELDEVIKKASYAIKKHEKSKWTDNSYFLIGRAHFLKGDYDAALETFQFISTNYKDDLKKKQEIQKKKKKKKKSSHHKKKKKKKKKKSSKKKVPIKSDATTSSKEDQQEEKKKSSFFDFLKPLPVRPQALIWLVDTYTELDKYKEADAVVTFIEADENFPPRLKCELEISKAHLAIERDNIQRAIEPLTQAIELARKKKKKARYYFILAQIYERLQQYQLAIENYQQVLKNRPVFDLEFNAKISIARVAGLDKSLSTDEITQILKKLLKDSKNKDFFDQVYFSMAELALSRGEKEKAIEYFKKSVEASTENTTQKAMSFYRIAEIYYSDENYVNASAYYDSTMTVLPEDNEDYNNIKRRSEVLQDLVKQIQIIEEQDSLLYIGSKSEAEREKLIENILKQKQKEKDKNVLQDENINQSTDKQYKKEDNATASSSGWYFSNPMAKSSGYNNFLKKWGNRTLEDNWRRSEKGSSSLNNLNEEKLLSDTLTPTISLQDENLDKEALLKAIPITDEQVKQSNQLIAEAMYKLANIYKSDLKNKRKAIETFEELARRYPDNKYGAEVFYNLYILNDEAGNKSKAEDYKNKLLAKFPDSRYAKYIINPESIEEEKVKAKQLNNYYSDAYSMYVNNQLANALSSINRADSIFKENPLKPKFALLKAQVIGKSGNIPEYLDALNVVVDSYPSSDERKLAEDIIDHVSAMEDSVYQMQVHVSDFKYDPEAIHYFLIAYNGDSVNSNNLSLALAAYNDVNRTLEDLKINTIPLSTSNTLTVVKSFKNQKTAMNYYSAVTSSKEALKDFSPLSLKPCIISDFNFNRVITHHEIESYFKFFDARYTTNP